MLSSLAQQSKPGLVRVCVAHCRANGKPDTESIVSLFSQYLPVDSHVWDDLTSFQRRGLVRNRQLDECKTEWLLFADSDMVYHPRYFGLLAKEIRAKHQRATYMLSAGRMSTDRIPTTDLVDNTIMDAPINISNAFFTARKLPKVARRNVGAGFSQLINVQYAPHGGLYVDPAKNRDYCWATRFSACKSDMQFRRRIAASGGKRMSLPNWFSRNLIHLNHDRDNEFGYHIEAQR